MKIYKIMYVKRHKGGATNLKVGGGVNTVKTQKIKKGGECMTPPPAPIVVPPLERHMYVFRGYV